MAGWTETDISDPFGLYKASFGDLIPGTIYEDGMRNINKAVNIGAADGAAGFALTPIVYDKEVIDITRRHAPISSLIPKRTNMGKTANYYRLTTRGAAVWGSEDPALDESDDTRESASADMKFLRVTGRITGVAQAAGAHFYNALNEEVMSKNVAISQEIERALILGDTATTSTEPNGLVKMLTSNNTALGSGITLSSINDQLDDLYIANGRPNLMITDYKTVTDIKQQMLDYARNIDPVNLAWGLNAIAFVGNEGTVPIVASKYMPTTTTEKRILFVDTSMVEQRVLTDISFEELGKTSDSRKFMLKTYRANICKAPELMGQLTTIS